MKNKTFPSLTSEQINEALGDAWDFIFLFIDPYFKFLEGCEDKIEAMQKFNDSQNTLLALNYLYEQVTNGGFLQLIQNGYGSYIFDSPFSDSIKKWGAVKISQIIDEANIIYQKEKSTLEKERDLEEFAELYNEYEDFEPLDDRFYEVMDDEVEIIKNYVYKHIDDFATLKENGI